MPGADSEQHPRVRVSFFKLKEKVAEAFTTMRDYHINKLIEDTAKDQDKDDKEKNEIIEVANQIMTVPVNIEAFRFIIWYGRDFETQTYLLKALHARVKARHDLPALTFHIQTDELIELFGGQPETIVKYQIGNYCEVLEVATDAEDNSKDFDITFNENGQYKINGLSGTTMNLIQNAFDINGDAIPPTVIDDGQKMNDPETHAQRLKDFMDSLNEAHRLGITNQPKRLSKSRRRRQGKNKVNMSGVKNNVRR